MRYSVFNGPMAAASSPTKVATGTSLKTMLQVKPFVPLYVCEWGCSFDGSSAAQPGVVELIEVDVAATVTAFVDNDVTKVQDVQDGVAASVGGLTLGVSASGYTGSAEGSVTASRALDLPQLVAPTTQFCKQFAIGERPLIQVAKFGRIRVLFGTTINMFCYMVLSTTP